MPYTFTDSVLTCLNRIPLDGRFETVMPRQKWLFNEWLWHGDRIDAPGGIEDEFYINYKMGETAKYTTPGAQRNPTFTNFLVKGKQPLIQMYYQISYIEEEMERMGQRGPLQGSWAIVNYIKARRQSELLGFYNKLEDDFLALPDLTKTEQSIWGLPYNIVPITAAQIAAGGKGAFQGENPRLYDAGKGASGQDAWCTIDRSDAKYAGLRNYNVQWDAASADTVSLTEENLARLGRAFRQLDFTAPIDMADLTKPAWAKYRLFTDDYMCDKLGVAARQQNDQLGGDVLKYLGVGVSLGRANNAVVVNGLPVHYAKTLDTASLIERGAHPLYGVNLEHLKVTPRPEKFMLKRPPASDKVHTPDAIVEYVDSVFNIRCKNPQQVGFVISYVE